jgi:hypothetical protein
MSAVWNRPVQYETGQKRFSTAGPTVFSLKASPTGWFCWSRLVLINNFYMNNRLQILYYIKVALNHQSGQPLTMDQPSWFYLKVILLDLRDPPTSQHSFCNYISFTMG